MLLIQEDERNVVRKEDHFNVARDARRCSAAMPLLAVGVSAQGLNYPGVTKDDWEEINFEFNSSVLVDGFPSLLRLAELLQKNPGYKVSVEGHTDVIGGDDVQRQAGPGARQRGARLPGEVRRAAQPDRRRHARQS